MRINEHTKMQVARILGFVFTVILIITVVHFYNKKDTTPVIEETKTYEYIEPKPLFMSQTPNDGIDEALEYYNVQHPIIVKAQAILETGHFTSKLCIENNNLFGLYDTTNKRYYKYNHWSESIIAYKELIQNKFNKSKYYYRFLSDIKYAKDPKYIDKLKEIVEELE